MPAGSSPPAKASAGGRRRRLFGQLPALLQNGSYVRGGGEIRRHRGQRRANLVPQISPRQQNVHGSGVLRVEEVAASDPFCPSSVRVICAMVRSRSGEELMLMALRVGISPVSWP